MIVPYRDLPAGVQFTLLLMLATLSSCGKHTATQQFNLECTTSIGRGVNSTTMHETFSVDVNANRWCAHNPNCDKPAPIEHVDANRLVLKNYFATREIDRASGSATFTWSANDTSALYGNCERKPFTGLPKDKF